MPIPIIFIGIAAVTGAIGVEMLSRVVLIRKTLQS